MMNQFGLVCKEDANSIIKHSSIITKTLQLTWPWKTPFLCVHCAEKKPQIFTTWLQALSNNQLSKKSAVMYYSIRSCWGRQTISWSHAKLNVKNWIRNIHNFEFQIHFLPSRKHCLNGSFRNPTNKHSWVQASYHPGKKQYNCFTCA